MLDRRGLNRNELVVHQEAVDQAPVEVQRAERQPQADVLGEARQIRVRS